MLYCVIFSNGISSQLSKECANFSLGIYIVKPEPHFAFKHYDYSVLTNFKINFSYIYPLRYINYVMPPTKSATMRYHIINQCLTNRQKKYWSLKELIRKLQENDFDITLECYATTLLTCVTIMPWAIMRLSDTVKQIMGITIKIPTTQ